MSTYVLERTVPIRALLLSRTLGAASAALTTIPPGSIVGAMLWVGYLGHIVVAQLNMMQA
jgi:hypothetical protein